jgi:hypothetical protein
MAEKVNISETGFHQSLNNDTLKVSTLETVADINEYACYCDKLLRYNVLWRT